MKLTPLVGSLVGVACMSFMLGTTAMGQDNTSESKVKAKSTSQEYRYRTTVVRPQKIIILTQLTDSRIPQRVVLKGQQVNSASPVYVVQGNELLRSGSTSLAGILSNDPSITVGRRGGP
jgi:hypothetical protein